MGLKVSTLFTLEQLGLKDEFSCVEVGCESGTLHSVYNTTIRSERGILLCGGKDVRLEPCKLFTIK